jgi:signal transduction histidine kinase
MSNALAPAPTQSSPPPLRRYQSAWRYALAVLIGVMAWLAVAEKQADHAPLLFFIDPALGLAGLLLLRYRRRWPFAVAMVNGVAGAVSAAVTGPLLVAAVSLSARRRWREIVPVAVLIGGIDSWMPSLILPGVDVTAADVTIGVICTGVAVATGMYIGARRDLIASLKDRADRAEREQVLRVAQAQATERTRIAREMHDVLAHRISRVAMHAGALAYRTDLGPDETRRAAEVIQTDAHEALNELRDVLGLLRGDDHIGPSERPQPTIADIGALVDDARAAGMKVTLDSTLSAARIPDAVGRNAYRVVQEGLTNAAKHAPDTAVQVRLSRPTDELMVEVRNKLAIAPAAAPPGSGLGLVGLAERAALAGGRLEHGRTDAGEFALRAWFPWRSS